MAKPSLTTLDFETLLSGRTRAIDVSGIRRVFELGAKLDDPINLSIGQPDFTVPEPIKQATIRAIESDRNGYTLTQGAPELLQTVAERLADDVGWDVTSGDLGTIITSGTSGGLLLAFLSLLNPGDEVIIPDPYFVIYPALAEICSAQAVLCDLYPDFRLTAARVAPLITDRTKIVLVNSPGNPSGVVLRGDELRELVELCEQHGIVLASDEIYDEFTYTDAREDGRCPSPARFTENMLLVRGFGKTYGCTGWRLGFAAGPRPLIQQMAKMQQYTFVCAPSMAQVGIAGAYAVDMSSMFESYQRKRDMVVQAFDGKAELVHPGGAFYAFVKVPARLGLTATELVEKAIERNVLTIPGCVFSRRDTHLRISFAAPDDTLRRGLDILVDLMA